MLTRILHNSDQLESYLDELKLKLTLPQKRHMQNMADALLVCEADKTLAALQRQFVTAPDVSNMADFLRISPWEAEEVRSALRGHQVADVVQVAKSEGAERTIYINIDDSLGEKDKATSCIEAVDWHYDHAASSKGSARFKKAFCYVVCTIRSGTAVATVDLQLYLRQKTVRRLNRRRAKGQRIPFRSKYRIVRQMLEQLRRHLPAGWKIVVQFDSW